MSIEIYGNRFRHGQPFGLQVTDLSRAMDSLISKVEPEEFMLDLEFSGGVLTPLRFMAKEAETTSFSIARPTEDRRLYEALHQLLRHEGVVVYAPGSPPVVGHHKSATHLPEEITEALGSGVFISSAIELRNTLFGV
ncbi:conserved hypothetical protein [Rubrivivax sp. A210]|uniref:hypothetical protein n=1 Tax=Rubrivivax sp. A210 TaxID=2772301 RepID=UPI00191AB413|nr:hypothetical protein [Rubrivivax sp. A210]CAD5373535.1 conserved hypothetical protein [Rubrivivax sp. A210]